MLEVVVLDRELPIVHIFTRAPLEVFEILSPGDTMQRVLHKLAESDAMGVEQIWLIDPKDTNFFAMWEEASSVRRASAPQESACISPWRSLLLFWTSNSRRNRNGISL